MLPPELIIRILGFTDYITIKNYREINKKLVDNNINFIFLKLTKIYPFLKYGKRRVKDFLDFENTWYMEQYEVQFEDYIFYIREFDIRKKNLLYFLLINNIFHKNITFHAVNNLKDSNILYFKKLCEENSDNYFQNYIQSIYF
jgi:hypothetical protein